MADKTSSDRKGLMKTRATEISPGPAGVKKNIADKISCDTNSLAKETSPTNGTKIMADITSSETNRVKKTMTVETSFNAKGFKKTVAGDTSFNENFMSKTMANKNFSDMKGIKKTKADETYAMNETAANGTRSKTCAIKKMNDETSPNKNLAKTSMPLDLTSPNKNIVKKQMPLETSSNKNLVQKPIPKKITPKKCAAHRTTFYDNRGPATEKEYAYFQRRRIEMEEKLQKFRRYAIDARSALSNAPTYSERLLKRGIDPKSEPYTSVQTDQKLAETYLGIMESNLKIIEQDVGCLKRDIEYSRQSARPFLLREDRIMGYFDIVSFAHTKIMERRSNIVNRCLPILDRGLCSLLERSV